MSDMQDQQIPADVAEILVDPRAYATDQIHDTYRWLRAHKPFGNADVEGFRPFWAVTKHADILDVSRRNSAFLSGDLPVVIGTLAQEERARRLTGGPLVRSLVSMDSPEHSKYRALSQGWFMPGNIKQLEGDIRAMARRSAERMQALQKAGTAQCDFVTEVALGYPLHVIMSILGVPEEDEPRMLRLTQQIFGAQDPDTARAIAAMSAEQIATMAEMAIEDFTNYFTAISADRRANPKEDLATIIANAEIDGEPIRPFEATGYYMIVATAGHDTTSSSTACAMWALANDPELFARVKADHSLISALIDEAIRWATPVKTFMRSAAENTEVNGHKVSKGDWLMLCYASGNRDEDVFAAPFEFNIDRKPNKHLAFGYGAHLCLGQHLAKMEMRILFEELLPRLKSVRPNGEPGLVQSTFVNGLKTLPIAFEPA